MARSKQTYMNTKHTVEIKGGDVKHGVQEFLDNIKGPYGNIQQYNTWGKFSKQSETKQKKRKKDVISEEQSKLIDVKPLITEKREYHNELYDQTFRFVKFIKSLSTVIECCLYIFNGSQREYLMDLCAEFLGTIFSLNLTNKQTNSQVRSGLHAIQLWNKLVQILQTYDAFVALAKRVGDGQLEKGFTTIERQGRSFEHESRQKQEEFSSSVKLPATTRPLANEIRILRQPSGNTAPKVLQPTENAVTCFPVFQGLSLLNPNQRLQTYSRWPTSTKVWPVQLSNGGFYFTGQGTTVKCSSCGVETAVETWITPEKPEVVHFKLNDRCEFLLGNFPYLKSQIGKNNSTPDIKPNEQYMTTDDHSVVRKENNEEHVPTLTERNLSQNNHVGSETTSNGQVIQRPMSSELPNGTSVQRDNSGLNANVSNDNLSLECGFGSICISENDMVSRLQNRADNLRTNLLPSPYSGILNTHGLSGPGIDTAHASSMSMDYLPSNSLPNRVYEPEFSHPQYRNSEQRLATFQNWVKEKIQPSKSLVKSGLYYTGEDDIVRCFCCNLGLSEWAADDHPWTEHARHAPKCWFLRQQKGQDYIDQVQETWRKKYKPKNPAFDDYQSRLSTFGGWREDISQKPEELADAGFFSIGQEDIVRCHYCDGGLRNWEPGDIPWEEHARCFPLCKYLIKMKGTRYIESIKEKYENGPPAASANYQEHTRGNGLLETEAAETVLRMGFTVAEVKAAVNKYVQTRGNRDFTGEDLIEIIFNNKSSSSTNTRDHVTSNRPVPEEKDINTLRDINKDLKNKLLCVLCKQNESCMLFVNCGHRVTCQHCCRSIDFCPTCDKRIKKVIKTFMS